MRSERLAAAALLAVLAPAAARADDAPDSSGPVVGVELGVAGIQSDKLDSYGLGIGKALVLGWRIDRLTIEWHFLQSYSTDPADARLRGDRTSNHIDMSSFTLRYLVFGPMPLVWGVAGLGTVSAPVIAAPGVDELDNPTPPGAGNVEGLGPVVGAALGLPIRGGGIGTVELRGTIPVMWELPRRYAIPGDTGPMGGVSTSSSTDDVDGVAWSLTLGLRLTI